MPVPVAEVMLLFKLLLPHKLCGHTMMQQSVLKKAMVFHFKSAQTERPPHRSPCDPLHASQALLHHNDATTRFQKKHGFPSRRDSNRAFSALIHHAIPCIYLKLFGHTSFFVVFVRSVYNARCMLCSATCQLRIYNKMTHVSVK